MTPLPITVILPTLDCVEKLRQHLDAAKDWLPAVAEVVAVDGGSTDGTLELLESALGRLTCAKVLSVEPGLYRAWNLAAAQASQPFIYHSTICDVIDVSGLKKLHAEISSRGLDVVVSVPRIVDEKGLDVNRLYWPIHFLEEFLKRCNGPFIPDEAERVALSAVFAPETILGSAASNIYRKDFLRAHPFPENRGKQGDVYWAMENLAACRVGFLPDRLASFCWDGDRRTDWRDLHPMMVSMCEAWEELPPKSQAGALHHAITRCVLQSKRRQFRALFRFSNLVGVMRRTRSVHRISRWLTRNLRSRL